MYKLLILLGLQLSYASLYSQYVIDGWIYDAEIKEPVVGATVQLKENPDIGIVTNAEGSFQIKISEKNTVLLISMLGYESLEMSTQPGPLRISLRPKTTQMQSVVVTANRKASLRTETPVAISKLSASMINETKATQLYEALNKIPGVLMVDLNNEQHFMAIRQPMTSSGYFLYLEDGVPIRPLGVFNHNALLEMNQFAISAIEVVKGPASSIYGAEAVGGAVNLIMQRPTVIPTAKVGVQFNNYGHRRIQFACGAMKKKFGFHISGLTSKQTDSWLANSDYNKTSVNARLEYHFSEKMRLIGNFVYGKYFSSTGGSVDSLAFYNRAYTSTTNFTYRKSDAIRSRISWEKDWKIGTRTTMTLFSRNNKLGQNPSYFIRWNPNNNPTTATGQINSNDFKSYGAIIQHHQHLTFWDSHLITGGLFDFSPNRYWAYQIDLEARLRPGGQSVEKYTIIQERPDIELSGYNARIKNGAGYIQFDCSPIDRLRFSAGIRYDQMHFVYENYLDQSIGKKNYRRATPKLGLTYDLGNDKGIYVNYAQGFSPPSLTSIFRKKPNTEPVAFYYNLKPALFNNYEMGGWATLWNNKIYIDIAAYHMEGKNELLNIRQPDNSYDYQSVGKTLHRGIELGLTLKPSPSIFFRQGGTVALHRFEDFQISTNPSDEYQNLAGFEMPQAPRWTWNTELYFYPQFAKGLRTSIEWQHVSSYYQNQINTVAHEGYNLINWRAGYAWKSVEVYTNLINVENVLYATNASRGNSASNTTLFTPAAPRTLVLGIQYNFTGNTKP